MFSPVNTLWQYKYAFNLKTSKPQNLKTSKPQNLKTSKPQNLKSMVLMLNFSFDVERNQEYCRRG